jgi:hypothetical protein
VLDAPPAPATLVLHEAKDWDQAQSLPAALARHWMRAMLVRTGTNQPG